MFSRSRFLPRGSDESESLSDMVGLVPSMGRLTYHHVGKAFVHLRLPDSSLPLGRNLDLKYTNRLYEVFKIKFDHFSHRITSGLIRSKDNLQDLPGPITSEDNLQVYLHLSNLQASPGFMLRQPISLT